MFQVGQYIKCECDYGCDIKGKIIEVRFDFSDHLITNFFEREANYIKFVDAKLMTQTEIETLQMEYL